jgi:hypothetical protein
MILNNGLWLMIVARVIDPVRQTPGAETGDRRTIPGS